MFRTLTIGLTAVVCGAAAGCAGVPDVGVTYYLPETSGSIIVTRTLRCDIANNVTVVSAVAPRVEHSANRSDPWTVHLADLDSELASIEAKIQLYPDGRLKGLNAQSTGQGGEIVKAAANLAASLVVLDGRPVPLTSASLCDYINFGRRNQDGSSDRSHALAVTFAGPLEIPTVGRSAPVKLQASPAAEVAIWQIEAILRKQSAAVEAGAAGSAATSSFAIPDLRRAIATVSLDPIVPGHVPVSRRSAEAGDVLLKLRDPATATIEVELGGANDRYGFAQKVSSGVLLSQSGTEYFIPIPKAALFGQQSFSLAVGESGLVTEIGYGKQGGAPAALGAAHSVIDQFAPATVVERLAATKAEADLIAQQQRLARCHADPASCE